MKKYNLSFIGAGKMATAIASGLASNKKIAVKAYDVSAAAGKAFAEKTSFSVSASMKEALKDADAVLLAVKPQFAAEALAEAAPLLKGKLLISIVAAWSVDQLKTHAKTDRIIRVMPNTPAMAGEGMACFTPADGATEADIKVAEDILGSVGQVQQVSEKLMDAVTGLSGSGPAFVMEFIMGLADGGVLSGLPRDMAVKLAIQTVLGTAVMCRNNPKAIAELRDAVISPAGTTAYGIMSLQQDAFKAAAAKAVIASTNRSAEMNRGK